MEFTQEKYNMLIEHLPYELDMLRCSYSFLARGGEKVIEAGFQNNPTSASFLRNSAIEAFWVHARCLLEFFRRESQAQALTACAADFTNQFEHYDLKFGKLEDLINEQVCHLQYNRHSDKTEPGQLNGFAMKRVMEAIDRAVEKFELNLTDDARALWTKRTKTDVVLTEYLSATNVIQVVTSTSVFGGPKGSWANSAYNMIGWTGPTER